MGRAFELLSAFADTGDRHALDLVDGTHLEGWVLDVTEEILTFGSGGPLAPETELKIPLGAVDLGSLSFYDGERGCWVSFSGDRA